MRTRLIHLLLLLVAIHIAGQMQAQRTFSVAFYNVENLFDTLDAPLKEDDEFTPSGKNKYTQQVYNSKLHNIATVISLLDTSHLSAGPILVGLAEVENNTVLEDLLRQQPLSNKAYGYLWFDGADARGIEVALLYDTTAFIPLQSRPIAAKQAFSQEVGRDILFATGLLFSDTVHILVNHWPSRRAGVEETAPLRIAMAKRNRSIIDSLFKASPSARIIVMGDMNDDPVDISIQKHLNTSAAIPAAKARILYNPFIDIYRSGAGTSAYQDRWNLYDQIMLSAGMVGNSKWRYTDAQVYNPSFLRQAWGRFKDYPYRSYSNGKWAGGYSDHFPVVLHFIMK